ncbi:hypothetical protein CKF54_00690 [Psittacicella hinzii]|uniref:Chromosome partition protein Smc n=1 Tax=Psittacicella hinzii TaxID=2028575 RepID=A0A3A1YAZ3_9GAMM|nr:hypothetical protein [Psittacicella hinzii]RIY34409.1 hypothetical protein CKF54_00690 [Psittacicella hinzii]
MALLKKDIKFLGETFSFPIKDTPEHRVLSDRAADRLNHYYTLVLTNYLNSLSNLTPAEREEYLLGNYNVPDDKKNFFAATISYNAVKELIVNEDQYKEQQKRDQATIEAILQEQTKINSTLAARTSKVEELEAKVSELNDKLHSLNSDKKALQRDLEVGNNRYQDLERNFKFTTEKLDKSLAQAKADLKEARELAETNQRLAEEKADKSLRTLRNNLEKQLAEEREKAIQELTSLQERYNKQNKALREAQEDLTNKNASLNDLTRQFDHINRQYNDISDAYKVIKENKTNLDLSLAASKTRIKQLEGDLEQAQKEKAEFSEKLSQAVTSQAHFEKEFNDLLSRNQYATNTKVEELKTQHQKELEKLTSQLEQAQTQVAELSQQQTSFADKTQQVQNELAQAQAEKQRLVDQLDLANQAQEDLLGEKASLEAQLEQLNQELNQALGLQTELEQALNDNLAKEQEVNQLTTNLASFETKLTKQDYALRQAQEKLDARKEQLDLVLAYMPSVELEAELVEAQSQLNSLLQAKENLELDLVAAQEQATKFEQDYNELKDLPAQLDSLRQEHAASQAQSQEQVTTLLKAKEELEFDLEVAKEQATKFEQDYNELKDLPAQLDNLRAELAQNQTQNQEQVATLLKAKEELEFDLEVAKEQATKFKQDYNELKDLPAQLASLRQEHAESQAQSQEQVTDLLKAKEELEFDLEVAKEQATKFEQDYNELKDLPAQLDSLREELAQKQTQSQEQVTTLLKAKEELEFDLEIAKEQATKFEQNYNELKDLPAQLASLREEQTQSQEQVTTLLKAKEELEFDLEVTKEQATKFEQDYNQLKDLPAQLANLRAEQTQSQEQVTTLLKAKEELEFDLEVAKEQAAKFEQDYNELKDLPAQLDSLRQELAHKQTQSQEQVTTLLKAKEELEFDLEAAKEQATRFEQDYNELKDLPAQLASLRNEQEQSTNQVSELLVAKTTLEADLASLTEQLNRALAKLAEQTSQNQALNSQVEQLAQEKAQLEQAKAQVEREKEQVEQEKVELQEAKAQVEQAKEKVALEHDQANHNLSEVKAQLAQANLELTQAQEAKANLANQVAAKETALAQATSELAQATTELSQVQAQLSSQQTELATAQSLASAKQQELEAQLTELAQLNNRLEANEVELATTKAQLEQATGQLTTKSQAQAQVQAELASVQTQLEQAKSELSTARQELSQAQQGQAQASQAQTELAELRRTSTAKQDELTQQVLELEQALELKEVEVENIRNESLASLTALVKEKESLLEQLNTQPQVEQSEYQKLQDEFAKFRRDHSFTIETLRSEKTHLQQKLDRNQQVLVDLRQRYDNQIKQLKTNSQAGNDLAQAQERIAQLEQTLASKEQELTNLQTELTSKQAQLDKQEQQSNSQAPSSKADNQVMRVVFSDNPIVAKRQENVLEILGRERVRFQSFKEGFSQLQTKMKEKVAQEAPRSTFNKAQHELTQLQKQLEKIMEEVKKL